MEMAAVTAHPTALPPPPPDRQPGPPPPLPSRIAALGPSQVRERWGKGEGLDPGTGAALTGMSAWRQPRPKRGETGSGSRYIRYGGSPHGRK